MTGYAHRTQDTPLGRVAIEIRSVNNRFTDLSFRLGDEVRALEPKLRERITAAVQRGKIECRLQIRSRDAEPGRIRLDETLIANLVEADARIRALAPHAAPLTVADYLRWNGSNGHNGADSPRGDPDGPRTAAAETAPAEAGDPTGRTDPAGPAQALNADLDPGAGQLWQTLEPLVEQTIAEFVASRAREGDRLAGTIGRQVEDMGAVVAKLTPLVPELLAQAQARLTLRLQEALSGVQSTLPADETFARVRQEIALLNLRGDVTEELDRLRIHFDAVTDALARGGAVGKRLDFLTQELNREANTIASKASGIAITDGAVALKLLIEQLREQVQNIE